MNQDHCDPKKKNAPRPRPPPPPPPKKSIDQLL